MTNTGKNISTNADHRTHRGFTLAEVLVAGMLLIIICVGVLQTYVHAIKINRGNNLRMQALSVLQQEVEFYRSLAFIPVGSDAEIAGGTHIRPQRTSADGRVFDITVVVDDIPGDTPDTEPDIDPTSTFKQITITAVPNVSEREGWLQELNTTVTVQRVRSN